MKGDNRIADWIPALSYSLSIRRALIPKDCPAGRNPRMCVHSSDISPGKPAPHDDDGGLLRRGFRSRWCAFAVLFTILGVISLGSQFLHEDQMFGPFRCRSSGPSGSSRGAEASRISTSQGQGRDSVENVFNFSHAKSSSELHDGVTENDKCWSRTRHLMYRRLERHFPQSVPLTGALQDYTALHARCTGGKKWEGAFGAASQPVDEDTCKYLLYVEGWEGLGNRLLSLVSAFTYALATDRVLLIDSRKHLSGLLCEPFEASSWRLPDDFPYGKIATVPTLDSVGNIEKETAVSLNLRHEQSPRDQRFFCTEIQQQLGKVQWLLWNSNQYYVPRIFMIPLFWTKLSPLFPDPSHVFIQLSRVLLLPRNAIWAKVERIYLSYLARSRKLVGLQVRAPHKHGYSQLVQDRIMTCVFHDLILPNVSRHARPPKAPNTDISIFVASLHRGYYDIWKAYYVGGNTNDGSLMSVYAVSSEGAERGSSLEQAVNAFIDIWLLSFSDTLVTSAWSTFGYVAQGLGAVHPYIVDTEPKHRPACYGGHSMEPCTHFPFASAACESTGTSVQHEEWMKRHIRACQDQPLGLQLLS